MCLPSLVCQTEMEGTGFPYIGADLCLHNDAIFNNKARTEKSGAELCSVNIALICYFSLFPQAKKKRKLVPTGYFRKHGQRVEANN